MCLKILHTIFSYLNELIVSNVPNTWAVILAGRKEQVAVFVDANTSQGTRMPL
jgi:hypothetical protein